MENFVIIGILAVIVVGIVWYLIRERKRTSGCVGCPCAKKCAGNCGGDKSNGSQSGK